MDHASPHATLMTPSPTQLRDDYLEFPQKGEDLQLDACLGPGENLHHKTFNRRMFFLLPA
jgi:hypothetical protein